MLLYDSIDEFFKFSEQPHKRIGTGLAEIDALIGGPAPGELAMVLGRSYAGKSLIGQNIVHNNATVPSIFFSLEMPGHQAVARLYSLWTDSAATEVQRAAEAGNLPVDVWDMAIAYQNHEIIDTPSITLDGMSREIEGFEKRHAMRPEFVVVDYLELLGGAKQGGEGMLAMEAQVSKLKDWAKNEGQRVWLLHQTNRTEPKWLPPTADSARWGGYTESDFVIGVWRPHWDPDLNYYEKMAVADTVCFNVLKNRAYGQDIDELRYTLKPSLRLEKYGTNTEQ